MTNRLFTFGCSFTRSKNPTWADIVARQYDHYQNWGQAGAGNSFIFYSLMEILRLSLPAIMDIPQSVSCSSTEGLI